MAYLKPGYQVQGQLHGHLLTDVKKAIIYSHRREQQMQQNMKREKKAAISKSRTMFVCLLSLFHFFKMNRQICLLVSRAQAVD